MNNVDPSGHEFFSAQYSGSENFDEEGGGSFESPDHLRSGLPSSEWEKINRLKEKAFNDQCRADDAEAEAQQQQGRQSAQQDLNQILQSPQQAAG